jgi:hypothetical protein
MSEFITEDILGRVLKGYANCALWNTSDDDGMIYAS